MIGYMISRIRNDKNVAKSELSRRTNINIGHISHIEKEERNPSHRALKAICRALEVPYQPLMYTYDKVFTEEQINLDMQNHIAYDKVLAVNSLDSFITCPLDLPSASLAVKIADKSMEPQLEKDSYAFVEFNSPLDNKDIGIFEYQNKVITQHENPHNTHEPKDPWFPEKKTSFKLKCEKYASKLIYIFSHKNILWDFNLMIPY